MRIFMIYATNVVTGNMTVDIRGPFNLNKSRKIINIEGFYEDV